MHSHTIKVTVAFDVPAWMVRDIEPFIQEDLSAYFSKCAPDAADVALTAEIARASRDDSQGFLQVHFSGHVDGRNFSFQTSSVQKSATRTLGGLGAVGGAAGGLVGALIARAATPRTTSSDLLDRCAAECCATAQIELNALLGKGKSSAALRWERIRKLRWVIAGVGAVLPVAWALTPFAPPEVVFDCLYLGPFLFVGLFLLVHVLGLAILPGDFYRNDAYGRKVMARSGVKGVATLRLVCVLFCAIILGMLWVIYSTSMLPRKLDAPRTKQRRVSSVYSPSVLGSKYFS
ncbi:MAG: hypothetical protein JNK76_06965 [Planctomycetales bacterium]|nr:hypothetical protein [Planctomycetales bacterium]MBN8624223.1 hypothetical protein [Planctomycetota bacterium]